MDSTSETRKRLEKQKFLHHIRNLQGIQYYFDDELVIKECGQNLLDSLIRSGFCSDNKIPDSRIYYKTNINDIIEWSIANLPLNEQQTYYLLENDFLIPFRTIDIYAAFSSLWDIMFAQYRSFTILNESLTAAYDFSSDSRDEDHFLFDKYYLS